jgi:hypothetical protein
MGLAAVGHHRVAGPLTAGRIFLFSDRLGKFGRRLRRRASRKPSLLPQSSPFTILAPEPSTPKRTPLLRP